MASKEEFMGYTPSQIIKAVNWCKQHGFDIINNPEELSKPWVNSKKCKCVYVGEPHAIEFINSPSGRQWAIGGTNVQDRWKFCPWCGGLTEIKNGG